MTDKAKVLRPDMEIASHLTTFCKEKGYGPEELLAAMIRISATALTVLNHNSVSGEIGKYRVEINLTERS